MYSSEPIRSCFFLYFSNYNFLCSFYHSPPYNLSAPSSLVRRSPLYYAFMFAALPWPASNFSWAVWFYPLCPGDSLSPLEVFAVCSRHVWRLALSPYFPHDVTRTYPGTCAHRVLLQDHGLPSRSLQRSWPTVIRIAPSSSRLSPGKSESGFLQFW